jgi:hypothetical protein
VWQIRSINYKQIEIAMIMLQNIARLMLAWGTVASLMAADAPSLDPHLEFLRPLLEKTWRGTFKNSTPDKPVVDISRWERALNGKAVRMLHSINQGVYGGETLFVWDEKKKTVTYYYFTTASYMTSGTMTFKDGKIMTHEEVAGDADGITEVKGTSEIQGDGALHVKTEYLKKGEWTPGHEATYREDSTAKVVFK